VAVLVALFLGEYEFAGTMPYVAGPLVGMVLGEIVVSLGKDRTVLGGVLCAAIAAAAILVAGGIDANSVEPIKTGAYVAAGLASVGAYWRAGVLHRPAKG
jgi:hypothetical protein